MEEETASKQVSAVRNDCLEERDRLLSQFGRVGGSQRRPDPQESRWYVPAAVPSCKVNIERS